MVGGMRSNTLAFRPAGVPSLAGMAKIAQQNTMVLKPEVVPPLPQLQTVIEKQKFEEVKEIKEEKDSGNSSSLSDSSSGPKYAKASPARIDV